jgi:hypothetical protein
LIATAKFKRRVASATCNTKRNKLLVHVLLKSSAWHRWYSCYLWFSSLILTHSLPSI